MNDTQESSKSFCLECKQEMRKWISNDECNSMCVNPKCPERGEVKKDLWNIENIKFTWAVHL